MKNKLNRLLTMNTGSLVSVFIVVSNKFTSYSTITTEIR